MENAKKVQQYFRDGNTAAATAEYAWTLEGGIHSYYHANRIVANYNAPANKDIYLRAWSMGDIGAVVLPYEMFDVSGMQVKEGSPFTRTFIVGYSYPSYGGYIPTEEGYANGGYEADNSNFAPGTAEGMVAEYLKMLEDMH